VRTSIDGVSATAASGSTVDGEGTKVEEGGVLVFLFVFLPLLFDAGAMVGVQTTISPSLAVWL
jgi:hypothetical protein